MKGKVRLTGYVSRSGRGDCIACWRCVEACPKNVFGKVRFLWHRHAKLVHPEACIGCGKCVGVCPEGLFELIRKGADK